MQRENRVRSLKELLGRHRYYPLPEDMANKPAPKTTLCIICGSKFLAASQWLTRWHFPNICESCCDWPGETARYLPKGFWDKVSDALPKSFGCPACGVVTTVKPELTGGTWQYHLVCPQCKQESYARYHLRRLCDQCRKMFNIDERHPILICKACEKPKTKKGDKDLDEAFG